MASVMWIVMYHDLYLFVYHATCHSNKDLTTTNTIKLVWGPSTTDGFPSHGVSNAENVFMPWASYQIRKIAVWACAGNAGNVSPRRRFRRKPLLSDPGMHHGTCVTHVPWCMSGSLTCGDGENVPGIPGACAPAILRIWQEAHCHDVVKTMRVP